MSSTALETDVSWKTHDGSIGRLALYNRSISVFSRINSVVGLQQQSWGYVMPSCMQPNSTFELKTLTGQSCAYHKPFLLHSTALCGVKRGVFLLSSLTLRLQSNAPDGMVKWMPSNVFRPTCSFTCIFFPSKGLYIISAVRHLSVLIYMCRQSPSTEYMKGSLSQLAPYKIMS